LVDVLKFVPAPNQCQW